MKKTNSCTTSTNRIPLKLFVMGLIILIPTVAMGQNQTTTTTTTTTTPASRLRIAIPVRGFDGFVTINTDPIIGEQDFGGFAVEVFKAVVNKAIPNPFPFDLIPITNGTFDDMLKAVFSKEYDGAVGDISIVDYRTEWVDFTMPYMETGISMLVPLKQQQQIKGGGISLVRVTKGFVVATLVFSFMVALVFWILEYRNEKCASQQQTASLGAQNAHADWQREILGSIIQTRLVMVLLFMILLVCIACYSAGQTSLLTTQRQSVPVKNLNQLIRKRANVGYQKGSFIYNLLIQKGLLESQLIAFNSQQDMLNMLLKGPKQQGSIAAVVGLTPHLRLLQRQRCDAFTLVPTFNLHAAGFGFAFGRESPLVHDLSNGILRVIYNGQLGLIQDRTIGSLEACQNDDQNADDDSSYQLLHSDTLWILVAGAIGVLLLITIIFLVHGGMSCNNTKKKKAIAYPCYLLPCC